MLTLLKQLSRDEYGVILSTELVVVGTVLTIGLVTGMNCLRQSIEAELSDVGTAISSLDQSYSFSAHHKSGRGGQYCAFTAGSSYINCRETEVVPQMESDCQPIVPQVPSSCCGSTPCGSVPCCSAPCRHSAGCGGCGGGAGCGSRSACGVQNHYGTGGGCSSVTPYRGGCGVTNQSIGHTVPRFRVTETPLAPCVPAVPMLSPLLQPIPEHFVFGHAADPDYVPAGDLIIPEFVW